MSVRIIVTGSRTTSLREDAFVRHILREVCAPFLAEGQSVIIVEGRCHSGGVDRAAQRWAERADGVSDEGHPADWGTHGRSAGMIRNGQMVERGADLCVGFPHPRSVGTWDCIKQASGAGIVCLVYPLALAAA